MSAVDMHSPSDGNESISRECSIIAPYYNEEDNVVEVLNEILSCCPHAEIIAVDDGSQDQTWERIKTVSRIKAFGFASNQGQSAAVFEGLKQATMPICILMDGDGQNDPADIPEMLNQLNTSRADVICGFRANRKDTWSRRWASRIANRIRRLFIADGIRDTGCSLKVFRKECTEVLIPFNGLHRFLPAFFLQAGFSIFEIPVNHRPRKKGNSKYNNWDRALRGVYDLVGVCWYFKRRVKIGTFKKFHGLDTV